MFSGGNEVCRRCDGPAADGFRRLFTDDEEGVREARFLGRLMEEPGGEPANGGEVAIVGVSMIARCAVEARTGV